MVRSIITIFRIFIVYKPMRFFLLIACLIALPAVDFVCRFLILYCPRRGAAVMRSRLSSPRLCSRLPAWRAWAESSLT